MSTNPLFIDLEASGLHANSFPVEVGWAAPFGACQAFRVRPTAEWLSTPWDPKAEKVHGISREELLAAGEPAASVLEKLKGVAADRRLYSDDVGHDERWLKMLIQAAGAEPSEELKLWCANILFRDLAAQRRRDLKSVKRDAERVAPATHRADTDARFLATVFEMLTDSPAANSDR
jgi:DNA polymerase III epsilon subunit-like protein